MIISKLSSRLDDAIFADPMHYAPGRLVLLYVTAPVFFHLVARHIFNQICSGHARFTAFHDSCLDDYRVGWLVRWRHQLQDLISGCGRCSKEADSSPQPAENADYVLKFVGSADNGMSTIKFPQVPIGNIEGQASFACLCCLGARNNKTCYRIAKRQKNNHRFASMTVSP